MSVSLTRQDQSAFFVAGLRATDDLFLSENYDYTNISGDMMARDVFKVSQSGTYCYCRPAAT